MKLYVLVGFTPWLYEETVLGVFSSYEAAELADLGDHDFDSYEISEMTLDEVAEYRG